MTDPTEQTVRRGLAELVRDKPALGPVDLEALTAARSRRSGPDSGRTHSSTTRWLLAAAVLVLVVGVGVAGWLSLAQVARVDTAEPQQGPSQLVGIRWLATQIDDRRALPDATGRVPSLIFESAERVRGGDPCNVVRGSYRLDGDRLRFDRLWVSEMACPDRAVIEQQSAAYHRALGATARVRRDGRTLTLLDAAGATVLIFRAADELSPAPAKTLMIRVRNDAPVDYARVQAIFPDKTKVDFGPVGAGRSSEYFQVGEAFNDAFVRIQVADGREHIFQPDDHVGDTPLAPGRYTYVLRVDGSGSDPGDGLLLEADQ